MITVVVPVKEIILHRVEGKAYDCKRLTFKTWEAATSQLFYWSYSAPKDGSYDKTDFWIEWVDGENYKGRFDLQHWNAPRSEPIDLKGHVVDFVRFMSGKFCPAHMTQEKYDQFIKQDSKPQEYLRFLEKYLM